MKVKATLLICLCLCAGCCSFEKAPTWQGKWVKVQPAVKIVDGGVKYDFQEVGVIDVQGRTAMYLH